MGKGENRSITVKVTVSLSEQIVDLLDQIADTGTMGQNRAEVARRFIDEASLRALANPLLKLKLKEKKQKR
jgi:hypothetical protein